MTGTNEIQHTWHERYRPHDLEGMALDPDVRRRVEAYVKGGVLPDHLLLYGPPGQGKTTLAKVIINVMRPQVLLLDASKDRGIDVIREKVEVFAKTYPMGATWKLVFLDEADGLTPEAQNSMRGLMERYSFQTKVILTANDFDHVIEPLRSRCEKIEMNTPPVHERARVLAAVLDHEGTPRPLEEVHAFAAHFPDMRELFRQAKNRIDEDGTLRETAGTDLALSTGAGIDLWAGVVSGEDEAGTDGAVMLNDLAAQFSKYLSLPAGGVEALVLWTVWAWASEAFSVAPILTLASPTMRAGKSTAFEVLEQLLIPGETYHPSSITPAVVFRLKGLAEAGQSTPSSQPRQPTLCLLADEADNWVTLRPELQGILNSGHTRRTAFVLRMVGDQVGKFSSWYPKALGLVDRPNSPLPDTLRDRSIIIRMQRKRKEEELPKFPKHRDSPELSALRERVRYWVQDHFSELRELGGSDFSVPPELDDRARDNWRGLMAIARVAGGGWEERTRRAALILSDRAGDTELLIDLLADIKEVFESAGLDQLLTAALVEKLKGLEGRQWRDTRLTAHKLSKMLRPLPGVHPVQIWTEVGGRKRNRQGYMLSQFQDAFSRYL